MTYEKVINILECGKCGKVPVEKTRFFGHCPSAQAKSNMLSTFSLLNMLKMLFVIKNSTFPSFITFVHFRAFFRLFKKVVTLLCFFALHLSIKLRTSVKLNKLPTFLNTNFSSFKMFPLQLYQRFPDFEVIFVDLLPVFTPF